MATPESALPSSPAAPPPPSSAPAPSSSVPAPSSAPADQGTPAPQADVAASTTPGAQPHPQSPDALNAAQARQDAARERLRAIQRGEVVDGVQPEVPIEEPEQPATPVEEPGVQPAEEPQAAVALTDGDFESLDTFLTEDQLRKRYHVPNKLAAELAARETQRKQFAEGVNAIGGEPGLEFSREFNSLVFKHNPTDVDAEAAFDALVLSEKGGARKLVSKMANHFVATALQDPEHGPQFASELIADEWGVQADGKTPYDLQFVDGLMKAHKGWGIGPDGKPIDVTSLDTLVKSLTKNGITVDAATKLFRAKKLGVLADEYIDSELADHPEEPEHEPTEREKQLAAEVEKLKGEQQVNQTAAQQKEAEQKADLDRRKGIYNTQARGWVRDFLMSKVVPEAQKANWMPVDGEEGEGLVGKKALGRLVSTTIQSEIEQLPEYAEVQQMIEDGEAFTREGKVTNRFRNKLIPLQNTALAMFGEFRRDLGKGLKFAASTSRNAQLAARDGRNGQQPATEPPPIAQPRPEASPQDDYAKRREEIRAKYKQATQAAGASVGTLR